MPQLVAFNRRWAIGSDDFVFPGIGEIILRIIWVIAISIVFNLHRDAFDCTGGILLKTYYIGLLVLLCLSIILTFVIVYISMQGSVTNTFPRRKLTKLIYVKFAISIPELAWNIMGSYWAFGKSSGCEHHVVWTVKGAVISGWCIAVLVIIGIAIVFDPLGGLKHVGKSRHSGGLESDDQSQLMVGAATAAKKVWETRCKILCCCVGCDEKSTDAFSGIAQLLSDFFEGIDFVPTDIACGLILVQREQERQATNLSTVVIEPITPARSYDTFASQPAVDTGGPATVSISSSSSEQTISAQSQEQLSIPKPWMTIPLMTHYMKYAMASYGWPLYIFTHLMTGACQLSSQCRCCTCIMTSGGDVHNDNCCQCHTAAIKKSTGLGPDDLLYVSFHNSIYEIPFYVAIDREQGAVVVAVRGTLSLKDVITDLSAETECLDITGLHSCSAHMGILQAAKYVKSKLEKLHILERAFQQAQGAKLVITGHSLGAGAAALLAVLLKPSYPDLRCYAFSPPGGLMSLSVSRYCQDFICSVVLGKDLIPRLAVNTMEDLKTKILRTMQGCDVPKYKLLASGVWQIFCGFPAPDGDEIQRARMGRPLLDDGQTNSGIRRNMSGNLEEALQASVMAAEQHRITQVKQYPPGQVLHILEVEEQKTTCCGVPEYYALWTSVEEFSEILVSPKMAADHMPDAVMRSLQQLTDRDYSPRLPAELRTAVI